MPRTLAACVTICTSCVFSADYSTAKFDCADGKCPSGLSCNMGRCEAADAGAPDARIPAFTCADPGVFAAPGGSDMGTTAGKPMNLSSMCGGFVMNGREAVYTIDVPSGKQLRIALTGTLKAYAIATCTTPAPACLGNAFATDGNPLLVSPAAGPAFVIVDDENPATTGTYQLTVTIP